jgi:hypothetical protein
MKNRFRFRTRLLAFFLAAQFLNVQIQSAYGTEAVMAYSPEQQQLLQHLEGRIFAKLGDRSENQLNRIAYRLYKLNVKLRNQVTNSNAVEFTSSKLDSEDRETIAVFSDHPNSIDQSNTDPAKEEMKLAQQQANPEAILQQADTLLTALGSDSHSDGTLSKASYSTFKNHVAQLKTKDLRAPASAGSIILKIILSLLVLAGAMAVLAGIFLLLAVFIFAGGIIINVGVIAVLLAIAGIIVGIVFAIKKIFSINPLLPQDPGVVLRHWSSAVV